MEYENFCFNDKNEIEKMLKSSNELDIPKILVGSINGVDDWEWLQNLCLKYVNHPDFWVSTTAISGLSDIARIHGFLEKEKVLKKISSLKNPKLKEVIVNTIDDISIFLNN